MKKRHPQYCPVARSLDLFGDRWSLLILRELFFGDQRFIDLRTHLTGISPTLLTSRLQALREEGLVETRELPPPAARTVYTATPKAYEAAPILRAMARFGMDLLPPVRAAKNVRPETAIYGALLPYWDARAAEGIDEAYRLVVDGEAFTFASNRRGIADTTGDREPDLVVTSPARAILEARRGERTLEDAIERGTVRVEGRKRALRNFLEIFHLA